MTRIDNVESVKTSVRLDNDVTLLQPHCLQLVCQRCQDSEAFGDALINLHEGLVKDIDKQILLNWKPIVRDFLDDIKGVLLHITRLLEC